MAVWIEDAGKALQELRDAVDKKGLKASANAIWTLFNAKPEDRRVEYAKYLGMLKRTKDAGSALIEVDEDDYDSIFNDNWSWRVQSKVRNTSYSSRRIK